MGDIFYRLNRDGKIVELFLEFECLDEVIIKLNGDNKATVRYNALNDEGSRNDFYYNSARAKELEVISYMDGKQK